MEKCSDVMTKNIVYCLSGDTVVKVAQLMNSRGIGSVLVIEDELSKKLVGIVTDRDLALGVIAHGLDPNTIKVESVMTRDVMTFHPEDDLQEVLDGMSEYQLRRIPVVDNSNKIIGIITQADVAMRVDHPEKIGEMVKRISQPGVFALQD